MKLLPIATAACLLIVCGVSQGLFLTLKNFRDNLGRDCYSRESGVVDGQREPVASSVDTLIYLVQKLEELGTEEVKILELLLNSFSIRDLYVNDQGAFFTHDSLKRSQEILECSVKNATSAPSMKLLKDDEQCALFFLLSNTLNKTATNKYREQGVAAVDPLSQPQHAVDVSRTLLGIYAGLTDQPLSIESLLKCIHITADTTLSGTPNSIHFATVSELIGLAAYHTARNKFNGYVPNGAWNSSHCPMVYEIESPISSFFTYARFRGAVDGLILGSWAKKQPKPVGLSAMLRFYYGATDAPHDDSSPSLVSYAFRRDLVDSMRDDILSQARLYVDVLGHKSDNSVDNSQEAVQDIWSTIKDQHFDSLFSDILKDSDVRRSSTQKVNDVVNDVIFVLDKDNVEQQMNIVQAVSGSLTAGFRSHDSSVASSVAVYLNVDGRLGKLADPVALLTTNRGAVGCGVANYLSRYGEFGKKRKDDAEVLEFLNETLNSLDEAYLKNGTVPGRAVVLFSFSPMKDEARLDRAVRALRYFHYDVPLMIVAADEKNVPDYVRPLASAVLTLDRATPHKTATALMEKLAANPVSIQFPDCQLPSAANGEGTLEHRGFVTRDHIQNWALMPHYFDRSGWLEVTVSTAVKDDLKVCVVRRLQNTDTNCIEPTADKDYTWEFKNPCKKHHTRCDPIYFIIQGYKKPAYKCNATECLHDEQIQFSIKHKGLRCGAMAVASSFGLLLLSLFVFLQPRQP